MEMFPANPLKVQLRAQMRTLAKQWRGDATLPCADLAAWLGAQPAVLKVAVFHPLPGEANVLPLLAVCPHVHWHFPQVCGDDLAFYRVTDVARELSRGAYGIFEPIPGLPEAAPEELDVFLCPGMGFDAQGGRLGRGKGFYDRLLARARPGAWKIGVGLPFQWVENTHMEPHDIAMDLIFCGLPGKHEHTSLFP